MIYDVKVDVPKFYLEEEEQKKYIELLGGCHDEILTEIDNIKKVNDYIGTEEKYINLLLKESPFNPPIFLTLNKKRILLKNQRKYLKLRGLHAGIEQAVLDLIGAEVFLTNEIDETFCIDLSWLGEDGNPAEDYIGFSDTEMNFTVEYHTADASLLPEILKLVDYMKWGPTLYNTKEIP